MSKYTTELRYICENISPEIPAYNTKAIIENALPVIFNFDFPIWEENYRTTLEKKIIKHYYFSEIGQETVARWQFQLDTLLNEILPKYNLMYKNATWDFNALVDVDKEENTDFTRSDKGTNESSATGSTNRTTSGTETTHGESTETVTNSGKDISEFGKITKTDSNSTDTTNTADTTTIKGNELTTETLLKTGSEKTKRDAQETVTETSTVSLGQSDTPQGSLSGVKNLTYLTSAEYTENGGNVTTNSENGETLTFENRTDTTQGTHRWSDDYAHKVATVGTETGESSETQTNSGSDSVTFGKKSITTAENDGKNTASETVTGSSSQSANGKSSLSREDSNFLHVVGLSGKFAPVDLIKSYREQINDIDLMIIKDLSVLFMQIY